MSDLSQNLRARVLETLALLASEEGQRKYQRESPSVDVPAQLFSQWDDWYHPSFDSFRQAFAPAELVVLEEFDVLFNKVSTATPEQLPPLDEFVKTDLWQTLSAAARNTLKTFNEEK